MHGTSKFDHGNYEKDLQVSGNFWKGLLTCQKCKKIPNTFGLANKNNCNMQMYCATCDEYFLVWNETYIIPFNPRYDW